MTKFNAGEKLLLVMARLKASELRITPESGLQFLVSGEWLTRICKPEIEYISGEWRPKIRELAVEHTGGLIVDLLGEDLANVVNSGKEVQTRYEIPGYRRFIVRASGREGHALLSAIPEDSSDGPDAD